MLIAAALAFLAFGCDDGARRPVQARVPALAPSAIDPPETGNTQNAAASGQALPGGAALPLTNPVARPAASLLPVVIEIGRAHV